uniref:Uncharacterized protein n=1 Tax=Setaria digitata TaxID=48799 RepID=A0A915PMJ3_9BILA
MIVMKDDNGNGDNANDNDADSNDDDDDDCIPMIPSYIIRETRNNAK